MISALNIIESVEQHDVRHILICFQHMGATEEQLIEEHQKLLSDSKYCQKWLKTTDFFQHHK